MLNQISNNYLVISIALTASNRMFLMPQEAPTNSGGPYIDPKTDLGESLSAKEVLPAI